MTTICFLQSARSRLVLAVLCLFSWQASMLASPPPVSAEGAEDMLKNRGEVYVSFDLPADSILIELYDLLSIDFVDEETVYAYANSQEFDAFLNYSLSHVVHVPPGLQYADKQFNMLSEVDVTSIDSWNFYPTYEAYVSMMEQFEVVFPDLYELFELTTLPSGRKLLFGVIGKSQEQDAKPRFMYTSTMHGDETIGFNLMLRLIHFLLTGYGQNDAVTQLIDQVEIWICPNENPDGSYTTNNATLIGATRSNSNHIDLNRNYPQVVTGLSSNIQPETRAMMDLVDSLSFVMSANIHSGFECVNYPWDFWRSSVRTHADHDWWQFVSAEYADTARYYSPATYMNPRGSNFINGVTHGGDWYTVSGSRQDYMNYFSSQRELTLELSFIKLLPADSLENHWQYNVRSLLNYMKQAAYGLHGIVADRSEGLFLHAAIEIPGYDTDGSDVTSSALTGQFYRPLPEGTYDVTIVASGYPVYKYEALAVENHQPLLLDADLGKVRFEPLAVSFPPAVSGGQSRATLFMKNTTASPIDVTLLYVSNEVFDLQLPLKQNLIIAPGKKEWISMFFSPDQAGEFKGELFLTLGMDWQPVVTIPLSGAAPEEAAFVEAVTPYVDFGRVVLGQEREATLTIRNSGNITLEISDVIISGGAFALESELPVLLAAGEFCDIGLSFKPDSVGSFQAILAYESNAFTDPHDIKLTGEGIDDTHATSRLSEQARLHVFPNPLSAQSRLTFEKESAGPAQLIISDLKGKQWMFIDIADAHYGLHAMPLGLYFYGLPAGVYTGRLVTAEWVETLKLIKTEPW